MAAGHTADATHVVGAERAAVPWWAARHMRMGLLLACLLGAVLVLLDTRSAWLGLGGNSGAQAELPSFRAGCPSHNAPPAQTVTASELRVLRAQLSPIMPARVGRRYEAGAIATGNLWSDDEPLSPPSSPGSPTVAGYEIRWWALDREGAEDDVVADVLEFATARAAEHTLESAASPHCRRDAASHTVRYPQGAHELVWVNPDGAREWDVMFVRGRRLYRVADVPPEYLFTTTGPRQGKRERRRDGATPSALACALPAARCPAGAASLGSTSLASLARLPRASGPGAPPNRAQAIAYAHAVNLRGYHVPGMTAIAPERPAGDRDFWEALARCTSAARSIRPVAAIRSPLFRYAGAGRYEVVYSTVAVFPSGALAARYLATVATARARSCIARAYRRRGQLSAAAGGAGAAAGDATRLTGVTALPLATPVPRSYRGVGPYRATALRLAMQASYPTRRGRRAQLPLYIEGFVFVDGRAVVELASLALPRPFPQANERFLETTLVGRAEANTGGL
jgi:hypothetical protein